MAVEVVMRYPLLGEGTREKVKREGKERDYGSTVEEDCEKPGMAYRDHERDTQADLEAGLASQNARIPTTRCSPNSQGRGERSNGGDWLLN
jgi:hypothetical protein